MATSKINRILIANRSEIASRIQFTCKKLGIKTVSICAPEDQTLPFVYQADQNYLLEKNGTASYLDAEKIIKIAMQAKVDAIHPGYGFFSENAAFAQKVIDAGLIWIGPTPKSIKLMANKIEARKVLEKIDLPLVPGIYLSSTQKEEGKRFAQKIGYPVLLKNPLGGGGKAIKKVKNAADFDNAFDATLAEAKKLTGSNQILLEKCLENARHIEIQVAGDGKNFIHLYERECSIQRRHQKIIEETPCNFVEQKTLQKIHKTAIDIAKTIKYQNIGTVEFLVTQAQDFYFLEMNTRLQVEHSITELITGIDLVELQIKLAQKAKLPIQQKEICKKNHSIECRIYAEDPENNFLPATGKITHLQLPNGPFLRHDHNLQVDFQVTHFFDPMLSKLTCWGKNRDDAIKNMLASLEQFKIEGVKTNINFLKSILNSQEFLTGNIHTQLLNNPSPRWLRITSNLIYFKKISDPAYQSVDVQQKDIAFIAATLFKQLFKQQKEQKACPLNNWKRQQWN